MWRLAAGLPFFRRPPVRRVRLVDALDARFRVGAFRRRVVVALRFVARRFVRRRGVPATWASRICVACVVSPMLGMIPGFPGIVIRSYV
jgi:hypothetical protein